MNLVRVRKVPVVIYDTDVSALSSAASTPGRKKRSVKTTKNVKNKRVKTESFDDILNVKEYPNLNVVPSSSSRLHVITDAIVHENVVLSRSPQPARGRGKGWAHYIRELIVQETNKLDEKKMKAHDKDEDGDKEDGDKDDDDGDEDGDEYNLPPKVFEPSCLVEMEELMKLFALYKRTDDKLTEDLDMGYKTKEEYDAEHTKCIQVRAELLQFVCSRWQ